MSIPDICERCGQAEGDWYRCASGGEWVHADCERTHVTTEGLVCDDHASSVSLALRFGGAMLYDPQAKRIEREAMEQATREYHEGRDA